MIVLDAVFRSRPRSRARRRRTGVAAGAALMALGSCAAAQAQTTMPVPGVPASQISTVREAGGQLLWTGSPAGRRITLYTQPSGGGPVRTLGTVPGLLSRKGQKLPGRDVTVTPVFDGTTYAVVVAGEAYVEATAPGDDCEGECELDERGRQELIVGSLDTTPRVALNCATTDRLDGPGLTAAIAAGRTFFAGAECGAPRGVSEVGADGTVSVVDAAGTSPVAGSGGWLAHPVSGKATKITDLVGSTSFTVQAAPPTDGPASGTLATAFTVQDDGTALIAGKAFKPGQAQAVTVRGPGTYDRVLALSGDTLIVYGAKGLRRFPLLGGPAQTYGLPGLAFGTLLADGPDVAALTCAGRPVVVSGVTPGRTPGRADGCPFVVADATSRLSAKRVVTTKLRCPNGCTGTIEISNATEAVRQRIRVSVAAGKATTLRVRLPRKVARGRDHTLYVDAGSAWLRDGRPTFKWRPRAATRR